jgi:hypothetical protein
MSNKKELTMSQFRAIIKEEAVKLKKRMVLEAEKKALNQELTTINESYVGETEMEESWIGDKLGTSTKSKQEALRKDFLTKAKIWKSKGAIRGLNQEMLDQLMAQAEADGFEGKVGLDKETQLMTYRPASDVNWAGLGLNKGGSFGGTGAGE